MDAIKRDIYVLRDTIQYRIEVTRGTNMIPIELNIRDFNIPTTATAVAYAFSSRNDEPSKMMCDIVENTIKFTPTGVFFETGLNQLMIRIINDGKRLISFEVPVWCKDNKIRESDKSEEDQQTLIEQLLEKNGNLTDQVDKERKRIDNLVAPGKSAIGLAKKQLTKDANKLSQTEGSHTHSTSWTSTGSDDDATFLASVKDKNVFVMDCFCRTHSSKTSAWEKTYHEAEATITINDDSVSVSATYKTTDTNTDAAIFTVVLGYDEDNREIADLRVDSDGVTHNSAGAAVRAQTKDVPAMRDCLQSPYVDVDLLELGNINKSTGAEEDSTKILRSERFKWNKGGKITAPSGYVITTANYTLQTHIGDNGAYTREVYQSTGGYANGMSHPQADSDKDVRRLLIKRSDGADINVEDLRGKITTNVPDLRAMDVLDKMQEEIENVQVDTDTTLTKEGAPADAAETGRKISQVKEEVNGYTEEIKGLNLLNPKDENIVLNAQIRPDGSVASNSSWNSKVSDFINIDVKVSKTLRSTSEYNLNIGEYKDDTTWIKTTAINKNAPLTFNDETAKIRIEFWDREVMIYQSDIDLPYEDYYSKKVVKDDNIPDSIVRQEDLTVINQEIQNQSKRITNLEDYEITNYALFVEIYKGKAYDSKGKLVDKSSSNATSLCLLDRNNNIFVTNVYTGHAVFFDSEEKYISSIDCYVGSGIDKSNFPENAVYVAFDYASSTLHTGKWGTYRKSVIGNCQLEKIAIGNTIKRKGRRPVINVYATDTQVQILEKLCDAYHTEDCDVVFEYGNYTFDDIFVYMYEQGQRNYIELPIGGGNRYYFNGSNIIADKAKMVDAGYSGTVSLFSCIYTSNASESYEMYDGNLTMKKGIYVVHDECGGKPNFYSHKYYNMKFEYISDEETNWIRKCIGGGTGLFGESIFENCIFKTDYQWDLSFHGISDKLDDVAKFKLQLINCYFSNTYSLDNLAENQTAECIITGCSAKSVNNTGTVNKWNVTSWNNEVRKE